MASSKVIKVVLAESEVASGLDRMLAQPEYVVPVVDDLSVRGVVGRLWSGIEMMESRGYPLVAIARFIVTELGARASEESVRTEIRRRRSARAASVGGSGGVSRVSSSVSVAGDRVKAGKKPRDVSRSTTGNKPGRKPGVKSGVKPGPKPGARLGVGSLDGSGVEGDGRLETSDGGVGSSGFVPGEVVVLSTGVSEDRDEGVSLGSGSTGEPVIGRDGSLGGDVSVLRSSDVFAGDVLEVEVGRGDVFVGVREGGGGRGDLSEWAEGVGSSGTGEGSSGGDVVESSVSTADGRLVRPVGVNKRGPAHPRSGQVLDDDDL